MQNGLICVCSAGRTGSSMLMQTLLHLGIEVPAPAFLPEHIGVEKYNPKGFYELKSTIEGVKDNRFAGKAVKLFGYGLINTPKHLISKVIYCQRDREAAIKSYMPIKEIMEATTVSAAAIHDANLRAIQDYLKDMDYMVVPFEGIRQNPELWVYRIIDYLEINPSMKQISIAVKNIDPIFVEATQN